MIKPEPVAWILPNPFGNLNITTLTLSKKVAAENNGEPLFTAAQMRQARVDALEEAAQVLDNIDCIPDSTFSGAAKAIRALIEQESK